MHAIVHAANVQDRDGGVWLMAVLFARYPFLVKLYADGGYQGPQFRRAIKKILRRTSSHFGFLGCGGVGWLGGGGLRRCSAGRARWRPSEGQGFQELGPGGEHNIGAQGSQVVEEAGSGSKRLAGVPPSA